MTSGLYSHSGSTINDSSGTDVFTWGRGDFGQLGIGKVVDCSETSKVNSLSGRKVMHVAAGEFHTAFLTADGELYSVGANEFGQLGISSFEDQCYPVRISKLETQNVTHVACGSTHTVAVLGNGSLAAWGSNEFGQLGIHRDQTSKSWVPKIVTVPETLFVQVACGVGHTLALSDHGQVYSFGRGQFGALGLNSTEDLNTPTRILSLATKGIIQVACGDSHSSALSVNGQVFTWGWGKYGQLGNGALGNQGLPVQVKGPLEGTKVVQLVCGAEHSMALTSNGSVFSWGNGRWGQTGLGSTMDTIAPQQVALPEGFRVRQLACGYRHSLALAEDLFERAALFFWGDQEQGQMLGTTEEAEMDSVLVPKQILVDALPVLFVTAGGGHSAMVTLPRRNEIGTSNGILPSGMPAAEYGAGVFPVKLPVVKPSIEAMLAGLPMSQQYIKVLKSVFYSPGFLLAQFQLQSETEGSPSMAGLDVDSISWCYTSLQELNLPELSAVICHGLSRTVDLVSRIIRKGSAEQQAECMRVLLIALQCPQLGRKGLGDLNAFSSKCFTLLLWLSKQPIIQVMVEWLQSYPASVFSSFLTSAHHFIANRKASLEGKDLPGDIAGALVFLKMLNQANTVCEQRGSPNVPYSSFYSPEISAVSEQTLLNHLAVWMSKLSNDLGFPGSHPASFCQFPFVLNPEAKSRLLQIEAKIEKTQQFQASVLAHIFDQANHLSPFLILTVHRDNLVQDAVQQLSQHHFDLKKPLKVSFVGEEAVDEGGVTKEFFQLLIREMFNVTYGMFTFREESRQFWFAKNSFASELEFQLVGTTLGLAIYNGVILDIHFPQAVYKKLLRQPVGLTDFAELEPEVCHGLETLLHFEGDVQEVFGQVFQVEYEHFGEVCRHDLVPNGGNVAVTNENRQQFVDLYVAFHLTDSVRDQFDAFSRGFLQVCESNTLTLFRSHELELVLCGLPHYDFEALEKVAKYDGGYSKHTPVIQWFWDIVHRMSLEEKKNVLLFTTGNDRSPVGGLGSLQFVIAKNGPDTDRLPTSHTCFNLLLLPEYASQEKLESRLKIAIENATGFGLQ